MSERVSDQVAANTQVEKCDTCARPRWRETFSCIDASFCDSPGGLACRAIEQRLTLDRELRLSREQVSSLISIIDRILDYAIDSGRVAGPALIAILAILEEVRPTTSCPWCARPLSVSRGSALIHYARNDDQRPCDASSDRVIYGRVVRMTKDGLQIARKP